MVIEIPIYSYPNIFAIGHRAIAEIFNSPVQIEEKIDGSQFSFGVIDGVLQCRSKGTQINLDAPDKLFQKAVDVVKLKHAELVEGYLYRGEYLAKPVHNTLQYSRVPNQNIIIFDISTGLESYMSYDEKKKEAERLGFEVVPLLYQGVIDSPQALLHFLELNSYLGGTLIEGVVVKNYSLLTMEKKVAMGKYVREDFKEANAKKWRTEIRPSQTAIFERLVEVYKTEPRWRKAVEHLRDNGQLEGDPQDIALLIPEVKSDILKECKEEIQEALFEFFWPKLAKAVTAGLPEWYKKQLLEGAFPHG